NIPCELHRLVQGGKQVATALEAVEDFADAAGDVVFGVTQLHVQLHLVAFFHFDQVLKAQDLELVAVLDQHVEVGVDQRGLVFVGDLKGNRANRSEEHTSELQSRE